MSTENQPSRQGSHKIKYQEGDRLVIAGGNAKCLKEKYGSLQFESKYGGAVKVPCVSCGEDTVISEKTSLNLLDKPNTVVVCSNCLPRFVAEELPNDELLCATAEQGEIAMHERMTFLMNTMRKFKKTAAALKHRYHQS